MIPAVRTSGIAPDLEVRRLRDKARADLDDLLERVRRALAQVIREAEGRVERCGRAAQSEKKYPTHKRREMREKPSQKQGKTTSGKKCDEHAERDAGKEAQRRVASKHMDEM